MTRTECDQVWRVATSSSHVAEIAAARLQVRTTALDYDHYMGEIGTSRVFWGVLEGGAASLVTHRNGAKATERVGELLAFDGLGRRETSARHQPPNGSL